MSDQYNPKFLDESSTQHLAWEIYADESSKAFFFLEYMSAVFTSPKSPVMKKDLVVATARRKKQVWLAMFTKKKDDVVAADQKQL